MTRAVVLTLANHPVGNSGARLDRALSTSAPVTAGRRLPVGADLLPGGMVQFRVWVPSRRRVAVVLETGPGSPTVVELERQANGYFAGSGPAAAGTRYRYRLDDDSNPYPDPASR